MPNQWVDELFTEPTHVQGKDWDEIVRTNFCSYLRRTCTKNRKSQSQIRIGTCSVHYGQRQEKDIIICPHRFLERKQVFTDCIQLLTSHEPGNELHIVPEVTIPGGHVDYFLASARLGKVKDFVGIELQAVDTTGTVWPARQQFLRSVGLRAELPDEDSKKTFSMNWKMNAKTILVQLHHKVETFEHINKHFVLVLQDHFFTTMRNTFNFDTLSNPAKIGDAMHFHAYAFSRLDDRYRINLSERLSTDSEGIARGLGLNVSPRVELEKITSILEDKISASDATLFTIGG